jgi:GNAT superfamily N-acetyltransferase
MSVMTDMLIRLYALPAPTHPAAEALASGHVTRKPIGCEHEQIVTWVQAEFGAGWASEARVALQNRPVSLMMAVQGERPIGFVCYDAAACGYVGPIGVQASARGSGVGASLLRAALAEMRSVGYGYAIAGAVGAAEFFRRVAGATEIADSTPGLYAGRLTDRR